MDPSAYTAIAHRERTLCNPVSTLKVDQMLGMLDLGARSAVVDVGCGKAEMLIRLIERRGVRGVGLDRSGLLLEEGRFAAKERGAAHRLELIEGDARTFEPAIESFDAALCIGACEILGGIGATIARLREWVRPGGFIAIGEGFWEREPASEYLAATGIGRGEFLVHADAIELGAAQGLTPWRAWVTSADEWDEYEWSHARAIASHVIAHPEDREVAAMGERSREWLSAYLRWGRGTLGFGMYLFRK